MMRLSNERHILEQIFRESPAAMALWRGPEMIFEMVNPQYQAIFPDRQLVGRPFLEALPEFVGQPYYGYFLDVLKTGVPFVGRESLARHSTMKNGAVEGHYYDFVYVRINDRDGNHYGVYDHAIDVTERVQARQALEQSKANLLKTVNELQEERALRNNFVTALSHDLRTPITAAKISAQMIGRKAIKNPKMQKLALRIADLMDRSDQMIRDLLDANSVKAGTKLKIEIENLELNLTAAEILEELSSIHGDRFKLISSSRIVGYWSKPGVQRILENLCTNAVKYGFKDTPVTISTWRKGDTVWIGVHNEGQPISPADQARLFEPFQRTASAREGDQKGWGLGLALVKGIARAHGGSVEVKSHAEKGTTFFVSLPLDARACQEESLFH